MATALQATSDVNLANLLHRLGDIAPARVRLTPMPPTAADVLRLANADEPAICELIDGVLVEKPMGLKESILSIVLAGFLQRFLDTHRLGVLAGEQGAVRLPIDQIRIPDLAFYSWQRLPAGKIPDRPIPTLTPDLAIEILSPGNTTGEMDRKRQDYFTAGVHLVWYIDPRTQTIDVYTPDHAEHLTAADTLTGGAVLPGFTLSIAELFAGLLAP